MGSFPCKAEQMTTFKKKQIREGMGPPTGVIGDDQEGVRWTGAAILDFRSCWVGVFTGPGMGEDSLLASSWEKWPD